MGKEHLNLVLTLTVRLQQISLVRINMVNQHLKLEELLTLLGKLLTLMGKLQAS